MTPSYRRYATSLVAFWGTAVRHEKTRLMLDLARLLASSAEGLTTTEMANTLGVSKRTIERMRSVVEELFPQLVLDQDGTIKRWRIPRGLDGFFQTPETDEMVELQQAIEHLRHSGHSARAETLARLERKIGAAMKADQRTRIAADVEALARAEIAGVRAGPQPVDDPAIVNGIREAIMGLQKVRFCYHGGSSPGSLRTLIPYGLLFDRMNYLVGSETPNGPPRNWRLDRISQFELLAEMGAAPTDFSMEQYAAKSFGVYHDEPEHVRLRIVPGDADEALRWRFHPHQEVIQSEDGSVIVSFTSSGMRELAWHLFTWRDGVEILSPPRLRQTMLDELTLATAAHSKR